MRAFVSLVLIVLSGFAGVALVLWPGVFLPFTLEALLLIAITLIAVRRQTTPIQVRDVTILLGVAFVVRAIALVVVHFGVDPYFFAPDALTYEQVGRTLAGVWRQGGSVPGQAAGLLPNYFDLNGFFILTFGENSLGAPVLNLFFGLWTVLLVYFLTSELIDRRSALWAAGVTAVFPSLVLWSVLNVRDASATFVVTAIALLAVRLHREVRPGRLVFLVLAFTALVALRDYMAFLVAAGLLLGVVASTRRGRLGTTVALGGLAAAVVAVVATRLGLFVEAPLEGALETAAVMRADLQSGAGSAYGAQFDTTTLAGVIRFLPFGLAFLLFAPFPWRIESPLQMAAMPETLLWYPLFVLALFGVREVSRKGGREWLMPACILLVVVTSYALVEGNFGTAYRHRAQIMPLFFVFASVGLGRMAAVFAGLAGRSRRSSGAPPPRGEVR